MKKLLLLACLFTLMQAGTPTSATPSPLPSTVQADGTLTLDQFREQLDAYTDRLSALMPGENVGEVPETEWNRFDQLLQQMALWLEDGTITDDNAAQYLAQIEDAWQQLEATIVRFDISAEGNYRLFSYKLQPDSTYLVENNPYAVAENTNQPWGFYARVVADGQLEQLVNHDEGNKSGETAWYRGSGAWFYITDQGAMHPMTNRAPVIMFTAPADGVYRMDLTLYRPNPNPSVENPLYVRWYHLYGGADNVAQTDQAILSQQYGSVQNDGQQGKRRISTTLFAYLMEGDRLFFEIDCYTVNRNSSAGTQVLNLTAVSHITDEQPLTVADAQASGQLFVNPYASGDCTLLRQTIAQAEEALATTTVGTEPGQYPEDVHQQLLVALEEARTAVQNEGDPNQTQGQVDAINRALQQALQTYLDSRNPVTLQPQGEFSIQLAGTERFLTRKDLATTGTHYYAAIADGAAVEADMEKNVKTLDQYTWTFTFTPAEGTTGVFITTEDGYLTADGYVRIGDPSEAPVLTLACAQPGDELFAIRRPDGLFWNNSFAWKSPYDIIATSASPQYIWQLSSATLTAIDGVEAGPTANADSRSYDLSGRPLTSTLKKGIYIRQGRKIVVK